MEVIRAQPSDQSSCRTARTRRISWGQSRGYRMAEAGGQQWPPRGHSRHEPPCAGSSGDFVDELLVWLPVACLCNLQACSDMFLSRGPHRKSYDLKNQVSQSSRPLSSWRDAIVKWISAEPKACAVGMERRQGKRLLSSLCTHTLSLQALPMVYRSVGRRLTCFVGWAEEEEGSRGSGVSAEYQVCTDHFCSPLLWLRNPQGCAVMR